VDHRAKDDPVVAVAAGRLPAIVALRTLGKKAADWRCFPWARGAVLDLACSNAPAMRLGRTDEHCDKQ
jgi:hypothetical protein